MKNSDIGLIGLGVMGQMLSLNLERNGFWVAGYDIDPHKRSEFLLKTAGKNILTCNTVSELFYALEKPHRILMMVPAGSAVDAVIRELKPYLISGDVLMDGGNSHFSDTERRSRDLEERNCHYLGVGVSGGEAGALWGPSIMPGGSIEGWQMIRSMLSAIAARTEEGEVCVAYIGPRGAGHYVKMVHNGIEYGDMQLIAEIYDLLHRGLGMSAVELAELFADWNTTELKSYLIEITADILRHIDPESGKPLVDVILDEAVQKGTGKWTSQNALDVGAPIPTINAAVESRILSSLKSQRVSASRVLYGPKPVYSGSRQRLLDAARQALYASKITSYAQGLGLLTIASHEYQYDLKLGEIAKIWRAGCIIRASLLGDIMAAYQRDPALVNLLLDEAFRDAVESRQEAWRFTIQTAVGMGIPVLALNASLAYFDAYHSERLPANLIQAQRDYFGAHTYRRVDREGTFHTEW
ncbi:MAG: phosphogluconate dehydrogenase (NADP(+)-dependent, decarboxylating) [Chloroflexi bacterium RBG_16_57_11]|nr:MAG: phosphogluconate dehydrogenase (NADP(+)-dependent, decarboxylating) [Chloroflexi bacterium RBG_16_57_11]